MQILPTLSLYPPPDLLGCLLHSQRDEKLCFQMAAELVATKLAEAILTQAVQRIADLLVREADSLSSVREDIEDLQDELSSMQCFLKDADHRQDQEERVRKWVADVRDLACEIEDAIEMYIYKVHSSYRKVFHLRKLRTKIDSIKHKLWRINERKLRYQINFNGGEASSSSLRNFRRTHPDDGEDDIISLKDTTKDLKDQLMKEEDRRCVVSIVGMGGIGKTTLAKKIYNDAGIRKHFDCHAWAFISQQYVPREILSEILMQVGFQSDAGEKSSSPKEKYTKEFLEERKKRREILKDLEDRELVELIKNELKDKRYLIVLDDIWRIEAWYSIQSAFPIGKLGSKIVFTTRIETVASSADPCSPLIKLPLLTPTESWELLKRKVFPRETFCERACPPEFEELGKDMVEKCRGLPLAIVVLGGLLRTKINSLDEWRKVQKNLKTHNINKLKSVQQYRVEDILDLSFQDLPYYLKPCFLYLGSFPEDTEIPKRMLVRLWIAEGFITAGKEDLEGALIEDVAEEYMIELIDRCMLQIGRRDHTGKGVKTCRLHDLMRDFCMSKAKEEIFLENMQPNHTSLFGAARRSRRVAIHSLDRHTSWMERVHPHLRSLLCSVPISSLRKKKFLLLRVLKLDFLPGQVTKLPKGTGDLIHLRYLRVSGVKRQLKVPKSIGNLRNLQTLDLQGNWRIMLPGTMSSLRQLRHLLLPYSYSLPWWTTRPIFGWDLLTKIETMKCVHAKDLIKSNVVLPLSNIRDLGITCLSEKEVTLVLKSLSSRSQLGSLRSLRMELSKGEFPLLESLSHCYVLSKLHLHGVLSCDNVSFLPKSLTKLDMVDCSLKQDKIDIVAKLPNLRILRLAYDYSLGREIGYKIVCSVYDFPKLEILTLDRLHRLQDWEVEEGAMPNLKRLEILGLLALRMVPEGLKFVTTLTELSIGHMTRAFVDSVRVNEDGIEGKDFYKVRHIPSITFSNTRE